MVSFTPRLLHSQGNSLRCLLNRKVGKAHCQSGRFGEQISCPWWESQPQSLVVQSVAVTLKSCNLIGETYYGYTCRASDFYPGAHQGEGGIGLQPPSTNRNLRNANSVDIIVLNILCDLLSAGNHPLKTADAWYTSKMEF